MNLCCNKKLTPFTSLKPVSNHTDDCLFNMWASHDENEFVFTKELRKLPLNLLPQRVSSWSTVITGIWPRLRWFTFFHMSFIVCLTIAKEFMFSLIRGIQADQHCGQGLIARASLLKADQGTLTENLVTPSFSASHLIQWGHFHGSLWWGNMIN